MESILNESEKLKRAADLLFAKAQFSDAIVAYQRVEETLSSARGHIQVEMTLLRTYSNCTACYLKLNKHKEASILCERSLKIPKANTEPQLLTKIYHRQALALEALEKYADAVMSIDKAIGIDLYERQKTYEATRKEAAEGSLPPAPTRPEPHGEYRAKLCKLALNSRDTFVALPPAPSVITQSEVESVIRLMLQCKCNPHNKDMMNALHALTEKRGFIDVRDSMGNTVLWAACQSAMIRAAKLKVIFDGEKKENENSIGKISDNASLTDSSSVDAKEEDDHDDPDKVYPVIAILLSAGANPSQRTATGGKTCLQLLALAGASKCVHAFVEMGADPNVIDAEGWTSLHVACAINSPARGKNALTVKMLLDAGATATSPNSLGMTPLALAAQSGCGHSTLLLLKAGSSINFRCRKGYSPTVWALIGSDGADNEAMGVLMQATLAHEKIYKEQGKVTYLMQEIEQDRNCYAFSRHVGIIAQIASSGDELGVNAKSGDDATNTGDTDAEKVASLCVLAQLGSMDIKIDNKLWGLESSITGSTPTADIGDSIGGVQGEDLAATTNTDESETSASSTETPASKVEVENNPLFAIWKCWDMIIPNICRKKWLPLPKSVAASGINAEQTQLSGDDYVETMQAAPRLDQCWLSIIQTAIPSNTQEGSSLLSLHGSICGSGDDNRYCRPSIVDDFEAYCIAPLLIRFCNVIPTNLALQAIIDNVASGANGNAAALVPAGTEASHDELVNRVCKYWNKVLTSLQNTSTNTTVEIPLVRLYNIGDDVSVPMSTATTVQLALKSTTSQCVVILVDGLTALNPESAIEKDTVSASTSNNSVMREVIEAVCTTNDLVEKQSYVLPTWVYADTTTMIVLGR